MDKYIKEYLLQHEKVQINGFGLFEIVYKSAEIHPVLHTVTVPGKYVVFSENSIANAAELTDFIASKEHISVDEANKRIAEWTKNVKDTVNQKKEYPLPFGNFFINAMLKIEFTPLLDTDISPESFGLEEFTIPVKSVSKPKQEDVVDVSQKPKRRRSGLLIFLFSILFIVLGLGVVCFLYPEDIKIYTNKAYSFVFKEKSQPQSTKDTQEASTDDTEMEEDDFQLETTQPEQPQEDIIKEEELKPEPTTKNETIVQTGTYYVVIGSFRAETNAQNFMNQKQKEYPNVVNLGKGQNTDLYMIGIGPFTKEDADAQIRNGKSGWWVVKK
jgi:nucleoid DNA-binding protein